VQTGKLIIVILKMLGWVHAQEGLIIPAPEVQCQVIVPRAGMGNLRIGMMYPQMKMGPWGKVTVPGVGMKAPLSGIGMSLLRVIMFM